MISIQSVIWFKALLVKGQPLPANAVAELEDYIRIKRLTIERKTNEKAPEEDIRRYIEWLNTAEEVLAAIKGEKHG
jgi:hypothetical protein